MLKCKEMYFSRFLPFWEKEKSVFLAFIVFFLTSTKLGFCVRCINSMKKNYISGMARG